MNSAISKTKPTAPFAKDVYDDEYNSVIQVAIENDVAIEDRCSVPQKRVGTSARQTECKREHRNEEVTFGELVAGGSTTTTGAVDLAERLVSVKDNDAAANAAQAVDDQAGKAETTATIKSLAHIVNEPWSRPAGTCC
jgi:hypothetical protein